MPSSSPPGLCGRNPLPLHGVHGGTRIAESNVAREAVEGLSNREIARTLGLSVHTVKNYLFKIFDKLGFSNRVELVLFCLCQEEAAHEEAVVHLAKSVTQLGAPRNTTKHETECKLGTATFGSLNSTTRARQKLCRIL
jgi:DNA-binding CsgD family transcriptional regulator